MTYNVFYTHDGCDCIETFTNRSKAEQFYNKCKRNGYRFVSLESSK